MGKILFTGGSGLLGSEIKRLLPKASFPAKNQFDVTDYSQMKNYLSSKKIDSIFHAAAYTSPPKVDQNPLIAIETNIIGTANIVKLCMEKKYRLIYMSTDYVFKGDQGSYKEDDPVYPANKYAWSKLGGECAVRLYDNSLIIRTTFGPNIFPYDKAFSDQWTSRESVSKIAKMIVSLIDKDITGTIHVGGARKTVYEYAKGLDPNKKIEIASIKDLDFVIPRDTSLNCQRYHKETGE